MWTRAELKQRTKDIMRKGYLKMFLVGLVLSFITSGGGSSGRSSHSGSGGLNFDVNSGMGSGSLSFSDIPFLPWFIVAFVGFALIALVVGLALKIFLANPLEVGCRKFFVGTTEESFDLNHLGYAFNKDRYWDIVITMLYRGVIILLWMLLLIVPGIIKMYAYRMVPYILADNPNIGHQRALELSDQMTYGDKLNIFVLDLSFIGWYLVGALALGIGVLFVHPYAYGTNAFLYNTLKERAIMENYCTRSELNPEPNLTEW